MDYRQTTCSNAINGITFLGGCHQYKRDSDVIKTWYPATMPTPVPLPGATNGGGACDCTVEFHTGASGSKWASALIGTQEWWLTQSLNQDMLTVQTFNTGSNIDLGKCKYMGFKDVAAAKHWHGCYGWTYEDVCAPATASSTVSQTKYRSLTAECTYTYRSDDSDGGYFINTVGGGSGTRTVGAETGIITSSFHTYEDAWEEEYTGATSSFYHADGGAGWSLDPFDGSRVDHISGMSTQADAVLGMDAHCCNSVTIPSDGIFGGNTLVDFVNNWKAGLITPVGYNTDGHMVADAIPAITDCQNYSATASDSYDRFDDATGTTFTSAYSLSISWSKTETTYTFAISYSTSVTGSGGTWMGHGTNDNWSFSGTLTLSDAYTASDVLTDCNGMLSYWDLTNNAIYPWRTDGYTMFMPLMARREVNSNVSPIGWNPYTVDDWTSPVYVSGSFDHYDQMPWRDPNDFFWIDVTGSVAAGIGSTHFDGAVLGKPFCVTDTSSAVITGAPTTGSGTGQIWGWFDFYYTQVNACKTPVDIDCGTSPPWQIYTYRYGGTLSDAYVSVEGASEGTQFENILPKCSTHWVDNDAAHFIPKGASVSAGIQGAVWVVKYAECRPDYNSHNFFRPCGDDRAAIDEDTAQCFVDDLVMFDPLTNVSGSILLAFTNGYDGVYTGSSQSLRGDSHWDLTLGTKIRDLPSNYYHPFEDQFKDADELGDYGLVGVLRFPDAWTICGREAVTITTGSAGSGSLVTFTNAQPNLATNDKVSLYTSDMGTMVTASMYRMSDTAFTCSNAFTGSITRSVWAMAYGAPDYHWQDTSPKLNYRYGEWNQNNRNGINITSASYDSCIAQTPCAESVVCFSPNGENFPNGVTSWFSGSIVLDEVYGSIRQLNVEFGMVDPFYQTPKKPCNINNLISPSYAQDDGTCSDDGSDGDGNPIHYYPPPPLIEAIVTPPTGSPSLPSGVTWTPMKQPQLPGVIGFRFDVPSQPWQFMANELDTCENNPSCRFIRFYSCYGMQL